MQASAEERLSIPTLERDIIFPQHICSRAGRKSKILQIDSYKLVLVTGKKVNLKNATRKLISKFEYELRTSQSFKSSSALLKLFLKIYFLFLP